jgi:recombination protein RecR
MIYSPEIDKLMDALRCLPSVGSKSAQRITFHLLERDREGAKLLAEALLSAMEKVQHCEQCRTFCETTKCHFCTDINRDNDTVCIVESPADVLAIEQTHIYKGRYFVLMGHLSPLDGMGPRELGLHKLPELLDILKAKEVILATNATVEGEATAHYIIQLLKERDVEISRIAHGIPLGSDLEYINDSTLAHALKRRESLKSAKV